MSRIEVIMPQMGESIAEGTILKWHKKVGDVVAKDETLLEISTDKVDSEIPSPAAGILAEIVSPEQATVAVRTVIAYLETDPTTIAEAPPRPAAPAATAQGTPAPAPGPRPAAPATGHRFYSPLVLNIARAEGLGMDELELIHGTGEGGRVSKKDVLAYAAARKSGTRPVAPAVPARETPPAAPATARAPEIAALRARYPAPHYEVLPMTPVLQKMAQHMVASVQTSPHVAAVHEVDMTRVVRHRTEHAAEFEQREGFKLTFTPYIVSAVVAALKKYPLVNSSVDGEAIIRKTFINIGIAVASESGLIVPVIKHAEEKNFVGLARAVHDLAARTRTKKLQPDDIQGGTFTISNYGVFGTLIGTPIINQPQVAILGTGAITKRVMVIDDALAVRSMAYFTMSFDHRIVDGALGGMFLQEVVRGLEEFDLRATA